MCPDVRRSGECNQFLFLSSFDFFLSLLPDNILFLLFWVHFRRLESFILPISDLLSIVGWKCHWHSVESIWKEVRVSYEILKYGPESWRDLSKLTKYESHPEFELSVGLFVYNLCSRTNICIVCIFFYLYNYKCTKQPSSSCF